MAARINKHLKVYDVLVGVSKTYTRRVEATNKEEAEQAVQDMPLADHPSWFDVSVLKVDEVTDSTPEQIGITYAEIVAHRKANTKDDIA